MGDRTLKALRKYLNVRRAGEGVQEVFTTREGRRITTQAASAPCRNERPQRRCPR